VSLYWSEARDLSPYVQGEQPGSRACCPQYAGRPPGPAVDRLREALVSYHKVAPEQVFVGNGSEEVLACAFAGLLSSPRPCSSDSFYPVYCRLLGSITT
jgi:histidinol-phosphate aminotransferase